MNRILTAIVAASLMLGVAAPVFAADKADRKERRERPEPGARLDAMKDRILKIEGLTDEQKAKIETAFATAKKELAELRENGGDPQSMMQEAKEILSELRETVAETLTDEQKKAMRGAAQDRMGRIGQAFRGLELSDDQKAQLKAIGEELRGKMQDIRKGDGEPRDKMQKARELMREYMEKARDVLTDEQKAELKKKMEDRRGGDKRRRNR